MAKIDLGSPRCLAVVIAVSLSLNLAGVLLSPAKVLARDAAAGRTSLSRLNASAGSRTSRHFSEAAYFVNPDFTGYVDQADCGFISGWAADRNNLNTPVAVSLYNGDTLLTTVLADQLRPDVGAHLGDNGQHGFSVPTPPGLRTGTHSLGVRFETAGGHLFHSPQTLSCGPAAANYQGFLDQADCGFISGWAADRARLNTSVSVDVYDGANRIATVLANQSRPDVGAYLGDNGLHGFSLPTPAGLADGQTHSLTVRFAGTGSDLAHTPRSITCDPPVNVSHADAVRFLEQATFGPTSGMIAHVRAVGFDAFLEEQFNAAASSYPTLPLYPTTAPADCPSGSTCRRDNYSMYLLQNRFFTNALYGQDQLRQRVAFALHQIIVVSGVEITQPSWMSPYLQTLDRNAFGNYRQLLEEVTLNPGMGNYLDMAGNTRSNPNENYGREVLQLFSIGLIRLNPDGTPQLDAQGRTIPTYTQTTVNNFARVFTGWRLATAPAPGTPNYLDPMVVNQSQHDTAPKTLLRDVTLPGGRTAQQDLEDALDNIFNDPNVGPFFCKQLIQHLVTSNPSPAYVGRVAAVFNDNGAGVRGDLRAVTRAILLDPEARGDLKTDPQYGRLRHPAQFAANVLRAFNARSADLTTTSDGYINPQAVSMGMDVFRPPSVFSYYPPGYVVQGTGGARGPEFGILSTSTALRRANFINTMAFSRIAVGANSPNGTSLDLSGMQALAGNPAQLVDALNALLMHGSMSANMRNSIITAVTAVPASNPLKRARTAVYLVTTSSQYQVQR